MRKRGKKLLAAALALSMSMNVVSLQVFADENSEGVLAGVPTNASTNTSTVTEGPVSVGTEKGPDEMIDVLISMTLSEDGAVESKTEYDVQEKSLHTEEESEIVFEEKSPEVKVDVPLTEDDPETAEEENVNKAEDDNAAGSSNVTGDVKESESDDTYDFTTETVIEQGSVTIETTDVTITETVVTGETDLDYVSSDAVPDGTNDLIKELANGSAAPDEYRNGSESGTIPTEGGDYEFVYLGTGNTSQLRPAVVFADPLTDEEKIEKFGTNAYFKASWIQYIENENHHYHKTYKDFLPEGVTIAGQDSEGFALDEYGNRIIRKEKSVVGPDGTTYYLHRLDSMGTNLNVEGWYLDGEWLKELNGKDKYGVIYASAQQFVLVDKNTGEVVTTYCADINTVTEYGFGYTVENLEDADYYDEEQAEMIRTIANNGYWGTEEGVGSLKAMKEMLRTAKDANGNRIFTDEEIDQSLTDGVALTATQMAIWSCSNQMSGTEFVNSHYFGSVGETENNKTGPGGNIPNSKEDEVKLMFKLYEYLKNLEPTKLENTTADRIINADNFLKDMSLTVIEKAEDHGNNQDEDDTNDAYVTNLTFALVVTPSTESGDNLIVKVLDKNGNEIASARIAGEAAAGESVLVPDADGNYTFANIVLIEGEQNFNITMEGIQNLKEGVYLYTSEVRTDEEIGEETTSQTMVGLASGQRGVHVSMNIEFELSVEDEVIAKEHVWSTEWHDDDSGSGSVDSGNGNDGSDHSVVIEEAEVPHAAADMIEITEDEVPLSDGAVLSIEDMQIPLAAVPKTGDTSVIWMLVSLISGFGLVGVFAADRKKRR